MTTNNPLVSAAIRELSDLVALATEQYAVKNPRTTLVLDDHTQNVIARRWNDERDPKYRDAIMGGIAEYNGYLIPDRLDYVKQVKPILGSIVVPTLGMFNLDFYNREVEGMVEYQKGVPYIVVNATKSERGVLARGQGNLTVRINDVLPLVCWSDTIRPATPDEQVACLDTVIEARGIDFIQSILPDLRQAYSFLTK